jgi:hypothetical protein
VIDPRPDLTLGDRNAKEACAAARRDWLGSVQAVLLMAVV